MMGLRRWLTLVFAIPAIVFLLSALPVWVRQMGLGIQPTPPELYRAIWLTVVGLLCAGVTEAISPN